MPRQKEVRSLLEICLARLTVLTKEWVCIAASNVFRIAKETDTEANEVRKLAVSFAEEVGNWIFSHVVCTLRSNATYVILKGLEHATEASKNRVEHTAFCILVTFTELVVSPHLHHLDLANVPKILRLNFYERLAEFRGLRSLVLGSGSGGWSNCYTEKFTTGLASMRHLVKFSLCYDCTDAMVRVLSTNCSASLKVLDVEMSKQVTDKSVSSMCKLKLLHTLHIHHTGLTSEGQSKILLRLPRLQLLVRGGFLCEALQVIDDSEQTLPELKLVEFWSSEEYFFHSDYQMGLLSKVCPNLKKIQFQFSTDVMTDLLVLATFPHLTELHLWGGDFYVDKISALIKKIGGQLTSLYLIHAEQVDRRALMMVAKNCPHLNTFGLYNCELVEYNLEVTEEELRRPWREEKMPDLLNLQTLALVSDCPASLVSLLLTASPNVKHLKTGIHCQLSDSLFMEIFQKNSLACLETIHIPADKQLSSVSLNLFMDNCPHLSSIQDLNYWESLDAWEVAQFRQWLVEGNYALDAGVCAEEAKMQKYLDDLPTNVMDYLMG